MYKLFAAILFFCISTCISAQRLSQVTFRDATNFSYYSFRCDYDVLIRVTDEGRIIEWGIERRAERFDYYDPKLQPYMVRIEYYTQVEDSAYRGKIKSIGSIVYTWYSSFDRSDQRGALKSGFYRQNIGDVTYILRQ